MKKQFYIAVMSLLTCVAAGSFSYVAHYFYGYFQNQFVKSKTVSIYQDIINQVSDEEYEDFFNEFWLEEIIEEIYSDDAAADFSDDNFEETNEPGDAPTAGASHTHTELSAEARNRIVEEELRNREERGREIFKDLLEINGDFLGMISIEGLGIDLPFVLGEDNEKYLETNFEGAYSRYGTVFLHYRNDRYFRDENSVLFGHHTSFRDMFTPLLQYRDIETLYKAPVIVTDTLVGRITWLVFAAYISETDFGYIETSFNGAEFAGLLEEIRDRSFFHTNLEVNENDRIITLSTCTYEFQDARFVVHARRLRNGERIPEISAEKNANQKPYNVPNQKNLRDLELNNAGILRNDRMSRNYFYVRTERGVEYFVGSSALVQGGYLCYEADLWEDSALSAVIMPDERTAIALGRLSGGEIYLLTGRTGTAPGPFFRAPNNPVTPEGVDARFPMLSTNRGEIWLSYSVTEEDATRIYRLQIYADGRAEEPECVYITSHENEARPAGMIWVDGNCLFVWQEKFIETDEASGTETAMITLKAAVLDEEWLEYYRLLDIAFEEMKEIVLSEEDDDETENGDETESVRNILGRALQSEAFGEPPETIPLPYFAEADRIVIFGVMQNDGTFRMFYEKAGRLTQGSFEPPRLEAEEEIEENVFSGEESNGEEKEDDTAENYAGDILNEDELLGGELPGDESNGNESFFVDDEELDENVEASEEEFGDAVT